jgi:hypothetical protein
LKRAGRPGSGTPLAKRATTKLNRLSHSLSWSRSTTTQVSALSVDTATGMNSTTNVPVAVEVHQSTISTDKPVHGATIVAECCAGVLCGMPSLGITFNKRCGSINGIQHWCLVCREAVHGFLFVEGPEPPLICKMCAQ